jgi:secondary thiamine-phosphate synthase enzyme
MVHQETINITTSGRGTIELTRDVEKIIKQSGINVGLCNIFIQHTSASLVLCENADPTVRIDMETFMSHLVPDGSSMFKHTTEGPDDMPAHMRSVLTDCSLSLPVTDGRCMLGTWQGIYLWEHRTAAHQRKISVTIYGD